MSTGNAGNAEKAARRRAIVIVAIVIAVILIAVAVLAAFGIGGAARQRAGATSSPAPTASASPSSAAPTTSPGSTPAPTATLDPRFGAPVAQTVPKDAVAEFDNDVSARITKITSTTATGSQAGEVSGPAARVELSITNGSSGDISLDGVSVNAYYGSAMTPASPIATQDDTVFGGTLAASKTAKGSYQFSVPKDQQSGLVITVSTAAGSPIVVFQG